MGYNNGLLFGQQPVNSKPLETEMKACRQVTNPSRRPSSFSPLSAPDFPQGSLQTSSALTVPFSIFLRTLSFHEIFNVKQ